MRKLTAILLTLSAIAAAGMAAELGGARAQTQGQAKQSSPVIPVTLGTAEARDMPVYVRGIGTVQAFNTVAVKSRIDGQIVKVDFTEGQEVKAGDLLFEIDPRPFQAALAQVQATKEKDEAQLVSAEADLKRDSDLVAHSFQTKQAFDQQTALVAQIKAAIKSDHAQIDTAQLNLQYAYIRAPIDGRTGSRLVDVGNIVHAADNTSLLSITRLRPIFVSLTVPQQDFQAIRESQDKAPIAVEAIAQSGGKLLATGKLTLIDNQIDQATGTLHLKSQFDNRNETLWPGTFVNLRLVVDTAKNAVTVPARAVQRGPSGNYLFVVKPDMTVDIRNIEVSETEDGVALVAKGLTAGERIVVDGQYRLDQGTKVAEQPPAAKPAS